MDRYLFRVGQMVTLASPAQDAAGPAAARVYKVLRLLAGIDGARAYRLKAIMEREPRVALESDCRIALSAHPIYHQPARLTPPARAAHPATIQPALHIPSCNPASNPGLHIPARNINPNGNRRRP